MALTQVSRGLLSTSIVDNGNATAITIDSSENVGIGGTPATARLEVTGAFAYASGANSLATTVSKAAARINGSSDASTSLFFGSLTNDAEQYIQSANGAGSTADDLVLNPYGGNVGIGRVPRVMLDVAGEAAIAYNATYGLRFYNQDQNNWSSIGNNIATGTSTATLVFKDSSGEAMRLDGDHRLLVGKTSHTLSTAGHTFDSSGYVYHTRSGDIMFLNRLSSDGTCLTLMKDDAAKGTIGIASNSTYIGGSSDGAIYFNANTDVRPWNKSTQANLDNTMDLGSSASRWDDVFSTGGINTSDRNEKQDIEELTDAEKRVAVACKGLIRKFRWKSSVEDKGDDARIHVGIISQDLRDAFIAEGLDPARYSMWCSDTWTDETSGEEVTRMSVRYNELLAFIIAAI